MTLVSLAPLACSDSTDPDEAAAACTDDTGSVEVTLSGGTNPTISWSPACAVALLLVEADAGDVWGVSTDDSQWDDPESANLIVPPVAYGSTVAGTTTVEDPTPLVSGTPYDVVLWRILPASSTAVCMHRLENACLMAIHEFVP